MDDRAPIRVRFLEPYRAWGIGSDPVLQAAEAEGLCALGVCELYDKPAAVVVPPAPAVEPEPSEPEPVVVTDDANTDDSEGDGIREPAPDEAASEAPPKDSERRPGRSRRPRS